VSLSENGVNPGSLAIDTLPSPLESRLATYPGKISIQTINLAGDYGETQRRYDVVRTMDGRTGNIVADQDTCPGQ